VFAVLRIVTATAGYNAWLPMLALITPQEFARFVSTPIVRVVLLLGAMLVWRIFGARRLIRRWCREEGYELLDWQSAWFFEGPNAWLRSRNQMTYRIEVRDRDGLTREGYLVIGSYWIGWPFSRRIRVTWD